MSKHFKRTCARYSPSHQDTVLAIFNLFTYTKTQTNTNTNKKTHNVPQRHSPAIDIIFNCPPLASPPPHRPIHRDNTTGLKKETQAQKTKEVELRMSRNTLVS